MIKPLQISFYDDTTINFSLPYLNKRVGILVSGGLDSALLYYLIRLYNKQNNNWHEITHYSIPSFDNQYAIQVLQYVNSLFDIPFSSLNLIGDGSLSDLERIPVAQQLVLQIESLVICGHIKVLPEHGINVNYSQNWKDGPNIKYPLKNLNKTHIVNAIYKHNLQELFAITKSCVYNSEPCQVCNRCKERKWAFDTLGKSEFDN